VLVERRGYDLGDWNLTAAGACKNCATLCPGVFEERPGNWGSRRRPVRLADFT